MRPSRFGSMAPLIRFLLINLAGGFAIGLIAGLAFIQLHGSPGLFTDQPLAAAMLLWAFAASFGMGAIGTGLALRAYE